MRKYRNIIRISVFLLIFFGCKADDYYSENYTPDFIFQESFHDYDQFRAGSLNGDPGKILVPVQFKGDLSSFSARRNKILRNVQPVPEWAKSWGIEEPANMRLNPWKSQNTTEAEDGFNSVILVYEGDYETALTEIRKIAAKVGLRSFSLLKTQKKAAAFSERRKLQYTNYSLSDHNNNHLISAQLEPDGTLIVMATDLQQLNNRMNSIIPPARQRPYPAMAKIQ